MTIDEFTTAIADLDKESIETLLKADLSKFATTERLDEMKKSISDETLTKADFLENTKNFATKTYVANTVLSKPKENTNEISVNDLEF